VTTISASGELIDSAQQFSAQEAENGWITQNNQFSTEQNRPIAHNNRRFFIFYFLFYKNIFSFSKFTKIYPGRPAAGRPAPGRPAAGRQGLICKNFRKKIAFRSLKDRSPGSRAAGPLGHPAAGRPVQASWFFNIFRGRKELVFHLPAGLIVTGSLLSLHRANQHLLSFFHAKHSRAIN